MRSAAAPSGWRTLRRVIAVGAVCVTSVTLAAGAFLGVNLALLSSDEPIGHWRSDDGRREYERLYRNAMELLPTPTKSADLPTTYGTVRAYRFESGEIDPSHLARTPLLLLPGFGGPAATWYGSIAELAAERPVIAIDTLGMAGASVQTRPIATGLEQAAWLDETISALGLDRVHLAAFSFGGLTAMNYARHHADRVASISLLDPAYVFAPVRSRFLVGGLVASLPLVPDAYGRGYTRWISGGSGAAGSSPLAPLLDHGRRQYATVIPAPEQLTAQQLREVAAPIRAVLAGRSVVHDPKVAFDAAAALPNVAVRMEPGASHAVHIEHRETVNREILAFAAAHDQ